MKNSSYRGLTIKSNFEEKVTPPDGSSARKHPYLTIDFTNIIKHAKGKPLHKGGFKFSS